jgi:hypothetical protein
VTDYAACVMTSVNRLSTLRYNVMSVRILSRTFRYRMHLQASYLNVKGKDHFRDLRVDGSVIINLKETESVLTAANMKTTAFWDIRHRWRQYARLKRRSTSTILLDALYPRRLSSSGCVSFRLRST